MSSKGWIKLYRSIQDCILWNDKPFDKCRAWIDLLLLANHSDAKIMFDGKPMTISAGCFVTSSVKLSERWGWSRGKTNRFLKMLSDERMIELDVTPKRTAITIVNYSKYQELRTSDSTTDSTTDGQLTVQLTDTNKNDKNVKNEKNIRHKHGLYQNVLLSDKEFETLKEEFPLDYEERIETLSSYIASTGKSYKNYLATIRNWARRDSKKGKSTTDMFDEWAKKYD